MQLTGPSVSGIQLRPFSTSGNKAEAWLTGLTESCYTANQSQGSTCLTMLRSECCVGYWKAGLLLRGRLRYEHQPNRTRIRRGRGTLRARTGGSGGVRLCAGRARYLHRHARLVRRGRDENANGGRGGVAILLRRGQAVRPAQDDD